MKQKLENIINRNITSVEEERFCPTGHVSRALKHFSLSQMRAYYWHRVSRSVQDAATEQENHLLHPKCQHQLRNPELGIFAAVIMGEIITNQCSWPPQPTGIDEEAR